MRREDRHPDDFLFLRVQIEGIRHHIMAQLREREDLIQRVFTAKFDRLLETDLNTMIDDEIRRETRHLVAGAVRDTMRSYVLQRAVNQLVTGKVAEAVRKQLERTPEW